MESHRLTDHRLVRVKHRLAWPYRPSFPPPSSLRGTEAIWWGWVPPAPTRRHARGDGHPGAAELWAPVCTGATYGVSDPPLRHSTPSRHCEEPKQSGGVGYRPFTLGSLPGLCNSRRASSTHCHSSLRVRYVQNPQAFCPQRYDVFDEPLRILRLVYPERSRRKGA